jgi:hypothetical protein
MRPLRVAIVLVLLLIAAAANAEARGLRESQESVRPVRVEISGRSIAFRYPRGPSISFS